MGARMYKERKSSGSSVVSGSSALPVDVAFPIFPRLTHPSEPLQNGGDAVLVCSADPWRFNMKRFPGDFADENAASAGYPVSDNFLPRVGLEAGFLFRLDMFAFKRIVRPPLRAGTIQAHGLR